MLSKFDFLNLGFLPFQNDYECRCLPGYSGKACHILPDGTVMKIPQNQDSNHHSRVGLIVAFSILVPVLVVVAAVILAFNKHKRRLDLSKANAKANWENELNALQSEENVNIMNTIKLVKHRTEESSCVHLDRKPAPTAATNVDYAYNKVFSDETSSLTSASCKQAFDTVSTSTDGSDDVCKTMPPSRGKAFDACCNDVKHSTPTKATNLDKDCSYSKFQASLKLDNSPDKSNSFRTKIEELCSKQQIIDL